MISARSLCEATGNAVASAAVAVSRAVYRAAVADDVAVDVAVDVAADAPGKPVAPGTVVVAVDVVDADDPYAAASSRAF